MTIKQYIPNGLSFFRGGVTLVLVWLIFMPQSLLLAQAFFLAGLISDKLDGTLARLWQVESNLGKKIESLVDPAFCIISGIYVFVRTDIQPWVFWYGLTLIVTMSLLRLFVSWHRKKLFYEKSPLTRYGVLITYILIFFYLFSVPYREMLLWVGIIYGLLVYLNYGKMLIKFGRRQE
ncbi:MAG: hypothetical protein A2233_00870 [Candidatus Kerfeldbacteria bacterium RIFOXYA2_FULL_38_24]|uniref:CDP-diacylglycerol--glycerol-3-phosphate 3-phosphatidyltransferase n=1 Tax=Candidatus Kerfeldbacteria bacterium RIFOXYB2_FULL_38_14 TaxID=1798547 RepID=A0A1G2BHF7_9BACT|nr:MAG: hypothetical protein A2233_00870 [Candidatus Kerfeldbacteria bacterium RIFOXYA2_FULL_38_24]OGY88106.1 MAG: hypothetical protein A2319_01600 [Candidatus Kerfeldbacteria bacterium RIFOXYB2_FULL_38_14]OGY88463.1 MAG: hypothetical protein A2458_02485 [Candidatus Kerfeldbacteria bacterium RIFOXYC2_FULL_38_9]